MLLQLFNTGIHTLELANALHHIGHRVCVYALDKDGQGFDYPLQCASHLVPTKPAAPSTDELIAQRIQEFATHLQQDPSIYDIYHAQDCISANALLQLRDRRLIPHIIRTVTTLKILSILIYRRVRRNRFSFLISVCV
jgi:hypothetical protein